ncbi:MAG: dTMP kinase [Anaerolineales bacterium]|nr:dTMP kinase [Anaerolineales bacterium]
MTFEGPDGSGKSTQIKRLYERLQTQGYDAYLTREPGGTAISEEIRGLLHDLNHREMAPRAEILLYSAARAQLVQQVIRPHLAAGGIVLCDRYYDSTLAYQGYGHGLDLDTLRRITEFATEGLRPDLTLLLDLDAAAGLARRQTGGVEWNRLDDYALAFHQRVRAGYLALAAAEPQRWVTFDALQDKAELAAGIQQLVLARLAQLPAAALTQPQSA